MINKMDFKVPLTFTYDNPTLKPNIFFQSRTISAIEKTLRDFKYDPVSRSILFQESSFQTIAKTTCCIVYLSKDIANSSKDFDGLSFLLELIDEMCLEFPGSVIRYHLYAQKTDPETGITYHNIKRTINESGSFDLEYLSEPTISFVGN